MAKKLPDDEQKRMRVGLRLNDDDYKIFRKISFLEERSMSSILTEAFMKDFQKRKKKHAINA